MTIWDTAISGVLGTVDGLIWRGWDLFRECSGHLMTNWGVHNIDIIQYASGMDDSGPVKIAPFNDDAINTPELDITETALERDWNENWHKKTPPPIGSFIVASRYRPVTMEYANGTVLKFLPNVPTAAFY